MPACQQWSLFPPSNTCTTALLTAHEVVRRGEEVQRSSTKRPDSSGEVVHFVLSRERASLPLGQADSVSECRCGEPLAAGEALGNLVFCPNKEVNRDGKRAERLQTALAR